MTDLNKTAASFDLFSKVLFVVDYNEEEIRHRAVETAVAEADCTREVPAKNVKLFVTAPATTPRSSYRAAATPPAA